MPDYFEDEYDHTSTSGEDDDTAVATIVRLATSPLVATSMLFCQLTVAPRCARWSACNECAGEIRRPGWPTSETKGEATAATGGEVADAGA